MGNIFYTLCNRLKARKASQSCDIELSTSNSSNKSTQTTEYEYSIKQLCALCLEREVCIILYPCAHYSLCSICADNLQTYYIQEGLTSSMCIRVHREDNAIKCPVCRSFGFIFKVYKNN